jgi:hypothetical protein
MKRIQAIALASLLLISVATTSCSSIPKILSAEAKDPASIHIHVQTIYGWIEIDRETPTNNIPYQLKK